MVRNLVHMASTAASPERESWLCLQSRLRIIKGKRLLDGFGGNGVANRISVSNCGFRAESFPGDWADAMEICGNEQQTIVFFTVVPLSLVSIMGPFSGCRILFENRR